MAQSSKAEWVESSVWGLGIVVSAFAVLAWGQDLNWQLSRLTSYQIFPLLGLVAFSLMWTHYIAGSLRRRAKLSKSVIQPYLKITGWIVLLLICLHPGLLVWQLWRDGFGLPPNSYLNNYVAPSMKLMALIGTVSLFIFLAYDTKRWFGKKRWWRFVVYAGDAAMLGIVIHGLQLGSNLQAGWFRALWVVYALLLVISLLFNYVYDRRQPQPVIAE